MTTPTIEEAKILTEKKLSLITDEFLRQKFEKYGIIEDGEGDFLWGTKDYNEYPRCSTCGKIMTEGSLMQAWRWFCANPECQSRKQRIARNQDEIIKVRAETMSQRPVGIVLSKMNVPVSYCDYTLDKLKNMSPIIKSGRDYFKNKDSVFITGNPGTGKTHLVCGLLYEYGYANPTNYRFENATDMMLEINGAIKRDDDYTAVIETFSKYPCLCIDDLGAEKTTESTRQLLYTIIDSRIRNGLQTVITSNQTIEHVGDSYGERIQSRIATFKYILIKGHDKRAVR